MKKTKEPQAAKRPRTAVVQSPLSEKSKILKNKKKPTTVKDTSKIKSKRRTSVPQNESGLKKASKKSSTKDLKTEA